MAVAADDAQPARGEVGDPRVRARPGPRRRGHLPTGERPADALVDVERDQFVSASRDDVEPVRRPFGVGVRAELALVAVRLGEPHAAAFRRDDEQASGSRQREQRRVGVFDADSLTHPLEDGAARRREYRCEHRGQESRADPGQEQRASRASAAAWGALELLERPAHHLPAPLLGVLHVRSFIRSRPRRRRELTVPRGRSSSSAISPGVYSRT